MTHKYDPALLDLQAATLNLIAHYEWLVEQRERIAA